MLLAGCSDELDNKLVVLPVSGDEIQFGAAPGGFTDVDPTTRTIYDVPEGSTFNDYTLLNIKWQYGTDQVRVYCPQGANGFQTADYTVQENTDTSTGYLVKNGETGVRWGNTNIQHDFYAFYSLGKIDEGLQNGTMVTATIPTAQEGGKLLSYNIDTKEEDPNGTFKIIAPDMTFCMMAGKGTWLPETDKNVALTFTPIVTVLDVLVNGPSDVSSMDILSISVRSRSGQNIVGTFSYNVASGEYNFTETDAAQTAGSLATIETKNTDGTPLTLAKGHQLNVKFFLLPRIIDDSDLEVYVMTSGGTGYRKILSRNSETVEGDGKLDAGLITRIKTPALGGQNTALWMSLIPDNVLFGQLSLPGSYNAFAYEVASDFDPQTGVSNFYQAYPPLSSTNTSTQFDEGIRVFDMKFNQNGTNTNELYAYSGTANLSPQITLTEVLDDLNTKINTVAADEKPTECAVLLLNYVNNGNNSVSSWLQAVRNVLDSWHRVHNGVLISLNANTIVEDVRGKIAVIVKIRESVSDGSVTIPSGDAPFIYIEEFSTDENHRDIKQYQLGSGTAVRVQHLRQCNNPTITSSDTYATRDDVGLVPYFITKENYIDPTVSCDLIATKVSLMKELNSEIVNSSGNTMYINDLSGFCVTESQLSTGYEIFQYKYWDESWWPNGQWRPINWWENLTCYDYVNVADMPTSEPTSPKDGDRYRNGTEAATSYLTLAQGGNSALFSELFSDYAINEYASLIGNLRQPLGIVLLSFAGVDQITPSGSRTYNVNGSRLPSLIMMNNFMFPLKTGETTAQSSATTTYSKGGDVWD